MQRAWCQDLATALAAAERRGVRGQAAARSQPGEHPVDHHRAGAKRAQAEAPTPTQATAGKRGLEPCFDTPDAAQRQLRAGEDGCSEFKELRFGPHGVLSPNSEDIRETDVPSGPLNSTSVDP